MAENPKPQASPALNGREPSIELIIKAYLKQHPDEMPKGSNSQEIGNILSNIINVITHEYSDPEKKKYQTAEGGIDVQGVIDAYKGYRDLFC